MVNRPMSKGTKVEMTWWCHVVPTQTTGCLPPKGAVMLEFFVGMKGPQYGLTDVELLVTQVIHVYRFKGYSPPGKAPHHSELVRNGWSFSHSHTRVLPFVRAGGSLMEYEEPANGASTYLPEAPEGDDVRNYLIELAYRMADTPCKREAAAEFCTPDTPVEELFADIQRAVDAAIADHDGTGVPEPSTN
jgi:hypothetical protein